jgi:hypothetical protein
MKKIFSLLFVLTTLTLAVNAQNESTDNPNAAEFKFEQTEHDFGTLDEGPKVTHVFNFTNTGKEPLIITSARASCGCTVPQKPEKPVLPGEVGEITVTYNTKGRVGNFNKAITLTSNAKQSTFILKIKGVVIKVEDGTPEKPAEGPANH